jgi:osmotically-inducible protein OsmY
MNDQKKPDAPGHSADSRNPDWDSYVPRGEGTTDEQIRADVHEALRLSRNGVHQELRLSVRDGVVTIAGDVASHGERERIEGVIAGVRSVKSVRSQLHAGN